MPSLGADMERGTIVEWRVKPGDEVRRGDIVAVVETEKSDLEIETFEAGTIERLVVPEGSEVVVGTVLALIHPSEAGGAPSGPSPRATAPELKVASVTGPAAPPGPKAVTPPAATAAEALHLYSPVVRHLAETLGVDLGTMRGTGPGGTITRSDVENAVAAPTGPVGTGAGGRRPLASPRAQRLAREHAIDLGSLLGTGAGGAITGDDVQRATAARQATEPSPPGAASAPSAPPPATAIPAPTAAAGASPAGRRVAGDRQASLRAAVANLMARSKREIPHYYLSATVDLQAATAWAEEQNAGRPVTARLLPAVLLLKATALAAAQVTEMNGYWVNGGFEPHAEVHLGVAVSLRGGGLLAPAIRDADRLGLDELMERLRDVVSRARAGSLRSSEMSDPTITVTNLGDQGVDSVYGVVYPPQVALVGFGRISERPCAVDGLLGVRPLVTATLAADHRASDGHRGARFLSTIDRLLQEPQRL